MQLVEWVPVGLGLAIALLLAFYVWYRKRNRSSATAPLNPKYQVAASDYQSISEGSGVILRSDILVIGDPGKPDLQIRRYDGASTPLGDPLVLDGKVLGRMNALLQHAPTLAIAGEAASTTMYTLEFAPEVAAAIIDGTANLHVADQGLRAFAVGENGIVGHGVLRPVDAASAALMSLAAWQLLSAAVGQKHLGDISRQLTLIRSELSALRGWLENDRMGRLEAMVNTLQQRFREWAGGQIPREDLPFLRAEINHVDREVLGIMKALELDLSEALARAPTASATSLGVSDETAACDEWLKGIVLIQERWTFAARVRLLNTVLLGHTPGGDAIARDRIRSLSKERHATTELRLSSMSKRLEEVINATVRSKFEYFTNEPEAQRKALLEKADGASQQVRATELELERIEANALGTVEAAANERARPVQLVAEINESGQVTQLFRVPLRGEIAEQY